MAPVIPMTFQCGVAGTFTHLYITAVHVHLVSTCKYPHTQGGSTPLYVASGKGHGDVVKTLIQNGADINLVSKVWRLLSQDRYH